MAFEDLTGQRFGRLKVISFAYKKRRQTHWNCICDCGNSCISGIGNLHNGQSSSCGCLKREKARERLLKHKHSSDKIYLVWKSIKKRCNNVNDKCYKNYGARGIKVCDKWQNDFMEFYNWSIQNGYKEECSNKGKNKLSIDRIDNNADYCPENCRWATNIQQARNKRNNLKVEYNGEVRVLRDLCDELNVPYTLIYNRIHVCGWNLEKALTQPKKESICKKSMI